MTGFPYHIWGRKGKNGRSAGIRTPDPYPPRKLASSKSLNYRAVRCASVLGAYRSVHPFLYRNRIAPPDHYMSRIWGMFTEPKIGRVANE